jgi:topoisomerase-4 subunit A
MLLEIPIRRISVFDLEKNREEIRQINEALAEVAAKLASVQQHVVRYLRNLIKKFGGDFPRRTKVEKFQAVAMREITATELTIGYQRDKGYIGYGIKGEKLLQCSSYDRLILFWKDGSYKVIAPPEKLFVDAGMLSCGIVDRDKIITIVYMAAVYNEDMGTYAKRFTVGGTILNKEYRCAPKGAEIVMFAEDAPPVIYVKYVPQPNQKISQQEFSTERLPVRDHKGRGAMMTSKKTALISGVRPADWNEALNGPPGAFMDFGGGLSF